ncbi:MAG: AGE family epimerase/isomerase [Clostridiales bacterium]|nr:AGE family epimerase/isomerase [Clostridiales bacterium]
MIEKIFHRWYNEENGWIACVEFGIRRQASTICVTFRKDEVTMDKQAFQARHQWVRDELKRCVDFWLRYGMDKEHGGVYTCLDRTGKIYSTDKSVWMQGRCGWIFAYLCTQYGQRPEWLEASRSCLDFLEEHCVNHDAGGRLYFTVTGDGRPLRQRRYCHSENFYTIANAEYYANTGDTVRIERARRAYDMVYKLNNGLIQDPTGLGPKTIPETRSSRAFGDPMIYLNVTAVMRRCDPENKALYDQRAQECVDAILKYHYKPELKCVLETVGMHGELQTDTTAGRVVNPGHDIEGSWFLEEQANYTDDDSLRQVARNIFHNAINAGWDEEYGGLLYFIDCMGCPPEAYEHDMKLWWPHNEILIASMMFYRDTGDEQYLNWFNKTADYVEQHFADPEYGEWYGYLRRDGLPTMPACKGSTFKGPFHVPRCLITLDKLMDEIEARP